MSLIKRRQWASWALAIAMTALSTEAGNAATVRTDYGGDGLTWESGDNWNPNGAPTTLDNAVINRTTLAGSLSLSTTQTIDELHVSNKSSSSGTFISGTSTLNILSGAKLTVNNSGGIRVGHQRPTADGIGSSSGQIIQSGGEVLIPNGTNGLRMSQSNVDAAESLYRISGGSLKAGAAAGGTAGVQTPLLLGATGNNFGVAEFHVVGNFGTSQIQFADAVISGSTASAGIARLHFTLSNTGVTPILLEDELRFNGTGAKDLVIDMNGLAPQSDITLILANRITTANSSPANFTGLPDLSPISASFAGITYNWLLDYTAVTGSSSVVLRFQSVSAVPEVSAFLMLGLVSAGTWAVRRWGT